MTNTILHKKLQRQQKNLPSLFLLTFAFSQLGNEYEDTSSV